MKPNINWKSRAIDAEIKNEFLQNEVDKLQIRLNVAKKALDIISKDFGNQAKNSPDMIAAEALHIINS